MAEGVIVQLCRCYPQLAMSIEQGIKDTPEYKNAVLRGKPVSNEPCFISSPEDRLETVETPVGEVEILYLANREDFEHALRALAYRCEPVEIPASVGASTIRGLINWQKIRIHQAMYLASGGENWSEEFRIFTSEKKNYQDTIILLSSGFYSAVPASIVGLSEKEWREKSYIIRKYHELSHFVCRTLWPKDIVPIRDEVIADLIGLVSAFGKYDPTLAKRFLGIENGCYCEGGRLSHYVDTSHIEEAVKSASEQIERLASLVDEIDENDVFNLLMIIIREN